MRVFHRTLTFLLRRLAMISRQTTMNRSPIWSLPFFFCAEGGEREGSMATVTEFEKENDQQSFEF